MHAGRNIPKGPCTQMVYDTLAPKAILRPKQMISYQYMDPEGKACLNSQSRELPTDPSVLPLFLPVASLSRAARSGSTGCTYTTRQQGSN